MANTIRGHQLLEPPAWPPVHTNRTAHHTIALHRIPPTPHRSTLTYCHHRTSPHTTHTAPQHAHLSSPSHFTAYHPHRTAARSPIVTINAVNRREGGSSNIPPGSASQYVLSHTASSTPRPCTRTRAVDPAAHTTPAKKRSAVTFADGSVENLEQIRR
jgi:hypothetical protein